MKCRYCGRELPKEKTGKRQREYCNNACRQAAFRQRHPGGQLRKLRDELAAAKWRIRELERFALAHAPKGHRKAQDVAPVELWSFTARHNVARDLVDKLIQANMLRIVTGEGEQTLDAEGQSSFWHIFNTGSYWQPCPDCPHGLIP